MEFIASNDITLHVKREGLRGKQPLVFINSLGSDLRIWDDVVPIFTDRFDVIRYDLRGHGLSDCPPAPYTMRDHAQDLAGLIETLDLENVILCGISVGAMIAMDFTTQHLDSVKALVVGDGMPKIGTADMWNQRIDTLRQHGMAHLADMILARWFAPSFKDTYPIAYRGYSNMLTRMPVTGYTGTCEAIRDSDLTEAVRGITCPTLVLCGAEDASTPPDMVRGLTEIVPNSRFVEIANAGHLPCVENPSATSDAIDTFLKDVL